MNIILIFMKTIFYNLIIEAESLAPTNFETRASHYKNLTNEEQIC